MSISPELAHTLPGVPVVLVFLSFNGNLILTGWRHCHLAPPSFLTASLKSVITSTLRRRHFSFGKDGLSSKAMYSLEIGVVCETIVFVADPVHAYLVSTRNLVRLAISGKSSAWLLSVEGDVAVSHPRT